MNLEERVPDLRRDATLGRSVSIEASLVRLRPLDGCLENRPDRLTGEVEILEPRWLVLVGRSDIEVLDDGFELGDALLQLLAAIAYQTLTSPSSVYATLGVASLPSSGSNCGTAASCRSSRSVRPRGSSFGSRSAVFASRESPQ